MPRQTIQVLPTDTIELDEDWGVANGIKINDLRLVLIGPKVVGKMLAALQDLQRELDDRDAREDGRPTEAEWDSGTGPAYAGLEDERGVA